MELRTWIMNGLLAAVLGLTGMAWNSMAAQIAGVRGDLSTEIVELKTKGAPPTRERLSVVEQRQAEVDRRIQEYLDHQRDIDKKLDEILRMVRR